MSKQKPVVNRNHPHPWGCGSVGLLGAESPKEAIQPPLSTCPLPHPFIWTPDNVPANGTYLDHFKRELEINRINGQWVKKSAHKCLSATFRRGCLKTFEKLKFLFFRMSVQWVLPKACYVRMSSLQKSYQVRWIEEYHEQCMVASPMYFYGPRQLTRYVLAMFGMCFSKFCIAIWDVFLRYGYRKAKQECKGW